MPGPGVADRFGRQKCDYRAQALSTAADDVLTELIYQYHIRVQAGFYQAIDGGDLLRHKFANLADIDRCGGGAHGFVGVKRLNL